MASNLLKNYRGNVKTALPALLKTLTLLSLVKEG